MPKRRMDEHRADSWLREQRQRPPLYVILDNIRSLTNVGTVFRAADGLGVRKIFLGGITPSPPRPEIAKISLGAEDTVEYEAMTDAAKAVLILQNQGVHVVAAEQTKNSLPIHRYEFPAELAIVFGHETNGVDDKILSLVDGTIEVPMFGAKHSHNVAVASALVLYEVRRQWRENGIDDTPP